MFEIMRNDLALLKKKENPLFLPMLGLNKNCKDVKIFGDGLDSFFSLNNGRICCFGGENYDFFIKMVNLALYEPSVFGISKKNEPVSKKKPRSELTFCGMTDKMIEVLGKNFDFEWVSSCDLYIHDGKPVENIFDPRIAPLKSEFWQLVSEGTPYHADKDDIVECIENRLSNAIYIDEKPVCWCLTHIENSLGMLYTLPEHRRKGYALKIMKDITTKTIQNGDTPYGFIIKGNTASQQLAKYYGMGYYSSFSWCGFGGK